jgi:F-type H+-transporting ATPase subunit alpha
MRAIDQVISLFAGIEGYLDDVPVRSVSKWESDFLKFIHERKSGIPAALERERKMTDTIEADLRAAISEFKKG